MHQTVSLTKVCSLGDNIVLNYNNRQYEIEIKETKPGNAISVIETDCNVDFEAPKDYVPPSAQQPQQPQVDDDAMDTDEPEVEPDGDSFLAFSGSAQRLDGKTVSASGEPVRVPLYSGLTRYPPQDEKQEPKKDKAKTKNGKNGKFVLGSGNRLLDKLQKDGKSPSDPQAEKSNPDESASAKPTTEDSKEADSKQDSGFKAFSGKGFKLK